MKIKFRAWFEVQKKMVYNLGFDQDSFNPESEELQTVWDLDEINDNGYVATMNYKTMQYIGRNDSKGKPIFEGDIVKLCDTNPVLFKVEIVLGKYGYKTVFKHLDDDTVAGSYFIDKCEVVGNIYENPEMVIRGAYGGAA